MKELRRIFQILFITGIIAIPGIIHACIWDADTLENENKEKPKIAEIIFGTSKETADLSNLTNRIAELKSNPRENEVAWWNDLAGAYLRLGQPQEAANLLEPVVKKFDSDYGVHANLGTAYHLLGRYQEAEKEIARDLEINPEAHFGLEKYHLALLQYLSRDEEYQKNHVYVDEWEWTKEFFDDPKLIFYPEPKTNFVEGVLYMASLNPKQPACFTMLGIACLTKQDFNLAVAAFEKAIALNSPQKEVLQKKIVEAKNFIAESHKNTQEHERRVTRGTRITTISLSLMVLVIIIVCFKYFKRRLSPN